MPVVGEAAAVAVRYDGCAVGEGGCEVSVVQEGEVVVRLEG